MKSLKYSCLLLLVFGLMTSCVSKKKFVELENDKDMLEKDLMEMEETLQAQIDDLKSANDELNEEKTKLSSDLSATKADFESRISDIQTELNMSEKQLNQVKQEVSSSFASIEKAVAEGNEKLKEMAGYLYLDMSDPIGYRSGSTALSKTDKGEIEKIAMMLKANPDLTIVVEGHTDKQKMVEGAAYQDNLALSVARATKVVRQLEKMGVDPKQIVAAGRGSSLPAVTTDPDSPETMKANRRTEFMVLPNVGKLYNITKEK